MYLRLSRLFQNSAKDKDLKTAKSLPSFHFRLREAVGKMQVGSLLKIKGSKYKRDYKRTHLNGLGWVGDFQR